MYSILLENWVSKPHELDCWVISKSHEMLQKDSLPLVGAIVDAQDFFPEAPVIAMPIPQPFKTGQIQKNVFLMKPVHIIGKAPHLFAMNAKFIHEFAGHQTFFQNPANCSEKIMNLEVLQAMQDEKHLQIVGVYDHNKEMGDETGV